MNIQNLLEDLQTKARFIKKLFKSRLLLIKMHISFKWQRLNTTDEVLLTVYGIPMLNLSE